MLNLFLWSSISWLVSFCWWQRGRSDDLHQNDSMTNMNYKNLCDMNVLYDLQILENITRLISWNLYWKSLSSVWYECLIWLANPWKYHKIDIMKFILKIFIFCRSKIRPVSFNLWFSSKFRTYYCLMRITIKFYD